MTNDELIELRRLSIMAVIKREGGYVNHPDDRGGATKWGITRSVATKNGYDGDMVDYPMEAAIDVYYKKYWKPLELDQIAQIQESLAIRLFDYGVNSGINKAAKSLQRLINVLNKQGESYPDVTVDGKIGSKTIDSLTRFSVVRGHSGMRVMSEALNAMRISFCIGLAEKRQSQEAFIFGWLSRIIEVK